MPDDYAKRAEFGPSLASEVNRILEDPIFHRSPVLSKLLKYLRDQTIDPGHGAITQFSIAVDGLGRREDYDQDGESYARVQISRLRKSLAEYYTRNQPGDKMCVYLPHGNYTLRLGSIERAYPELRQAAVMSAGATASPAPTGGSRASFSRPSGISVIAVLAMVSLLFWTAVALGPKLFQKEPAIAAPPRVAIQVDSEGATSGDQETLRHRDLAEAELRKAMASTAVAVQSEARNAAYHLLIDLGPAAQPPTQAIIRLTNADNFTIFAQTLPVAGDETQFVRSLDSALGDIFSTSGVIAGDLSDQFDIQKPKTDFECFLAVEAERASGQLIKAMLDRCLSTYPNSSYAPYWYSRLSYTEYQIAIYQGRPVRKNSAGWESLVAALTRDRFNPFANGVAAKVELAEENCEQSRIYLSRSVARSLTFPSMRAGLLVDTLPCAKDARERRVLENAFKDLLVSEPDADPVLRLYLTLGALEFGKADLARTILANAIAKPKANGSVAKALSAISSALDPANPKQDGKQLALWVSCFAWNPAAQKRILETIEKAGKAPSTAQRSTDI